MPPILVSHFELLEELGAGGMGTVYKARDMRLHRIVAIKFLSPGLLDSAAERERFRHEGVALSSLSHPHIATVFEVGDPNGEPFIALEYLGGGTLRSRIRVARNKLTDAVIAKWGADLADGLDHAHRRGVIHRDIKSSNVMFDAEGNVKLVDFGLSVSPQAERKPRPGEIEGTLAYIAPELFDGGVPDESSDLFSLGVLLFEMATGRPPFEGNEAADLIEKIRTAQPPPLRSLRPDIGDGLESIVARLLRKQPSERFSSAAQAARALRAVMDANAAGPMAPTVTAPVVRTKSNRVRRRSAAVLATVAGLAMLANSSQIRRWLWQETVPDTRHLAVLPIRSIGGDASQSAFCDGLTEALTTALGRRTSFSVVPAAESRKLQSASDARREFGVTLAIASTAQRREDQLRVVISLIDAVTLRQLVSETIEMPASRVFELEESVIGRISDMLNVSTAAGQVPPGQGGSKNSAAYDAYLRAKGFLYRWDKAGNRERALDQFEEAVHLDPGFVRAYVGIADTRLALSRFHRDTAQLTFARAAAEEAIARDPRLPSAHMAMGGVLTELGEPARAAAELQLAIRLDPQDSSSYRELAKLYRSQKRFADAENTYRAAIAIRPKEWSLYHDLGSLYLTSIRNYKEAENAFRRVVELSPDNHLGYRNLATALIMAGAAPKEAEALLRRAIALNATSRSYNNLGALLMFHRRYKDAVPVMERAVELAASEGTNDYKASGNLGDAYWLSHGSPDKARKAWMQALAVVEKRQQNRPPDGALLASRAIYEAKTGDKPASERDAAHALRVAPENPEVHYFAAIAYAVNRNHARALDELRLAAQLGYSLEEIRRAPEFGEYYNLTAFEQIVGPSVSPKPLDRK